MQKYLGFSKYSKILRTRGEKNIEIKIAILIAAGN